MRQTQFGTHCVPIREALEKCSHVAQIALIKTLAIARMRPPALFEFDDVATDLPAGLHLNHINGA